MDPASLNTEFVDAVAMTPADVARVRELLIEHHTETGSTVAGRLIDLDDATLSARFTRIEPRAWARVMEVRARAEADGHTDTQVTQLMMEAAHA